MLPVLVAMAVLAPAGVAGGDAAPVVAVAGGRVAGATETSTKGREFHAYYGVPFARPPLGELRLKVGKEGRSQRCLDTEDGNVCVCLCTWICIHA